MVEADIVTPERFEFEDLVLRDQSSGEVLASSALALGISTQPDPCIPTTTTLCLDDGRFRVEVEWRDFEGRLGLGQVHTSSDDSGLFWFFGEDNWEMLIKVLDGCALNDRFWVFSAATTNVEYNLQVTDTLTGQRREYFNALGNAAPATTDTAAFDSCNSAASSPDIPSPLRLPKSTPVNLDLGMEPRSSLSTTVCTAENGATVLCLIDNRFEVRVDWRDFDERTGSGRLAFQSTNSGVFWFFDDENWEMLVKVLDGCSINNSYWVFAAATTNVEYALTVTDIQSGLRAEYFNPLGQNSPAITDTSALSSCP